MIILKKYILFNKLINMKNLINKIQSLRSPNKLSALSLSAFLFLSLNFYGFSNVNPREDNQKESKKMIYDLLPEKFRQKIKDYKIIGVREVDPIPKYISEKWFTRVKYDVDKDNLADVLEFYRIVGYTDGGIREKSKYIHNLQPMIYGFDCNGDGKIEKNEMIFDLDEDGLNGSQEEYFGEDS